MTIETLAGPVISAVVSGVMVGLASYVAIRVSVAKLETWRQSDVERLTKLERALGVGASNPVFVRHTECRLMDAAAQGRISAIAQRVDGIENRVNDVTERVRDLEGS